ncbi:MAG: hypothetical protein M0Q42_11505 [Xanthomonadales bacterium]|nr:hypothetical protein [Xanthomonadales bacterium]
MNTTLAHGCLAVLTAALLAACTGSAPAPGVSHDGGASAATSDTWLQGTVNERLDTIADQLRGFGTAMVEVDHRYRELYFAGQDRNWDYAAYQIAEMEEAIEYGLQRRPARAASAAMLEPALDQVKAGVSAQDATAFEQAFATLAASCNACHLAEDVSFIRVATPAQRVSSIRSDPESNAPTP